MYILSEKEKTQCQRGFSSLSTFPARPVRKLQSRSNSHKNLQAYRCLPNRLSTSMTSTVVPGCAFSTLIPPIFTPSNLIRALSYAHLPPARSSNIFEGKSSRISMSCLHGQIIVLIQGRYLDKVAFVHVIAFLLPCSFSSLDLYIGGSEEKSNDATARPYLGEPCAIRGV